MREHGIIGGDVNHKLADGLLSTEEKKAVQVEVVDNDIIALLQRNIHCAGHFPTGKKFPY